MSQLLGDIKLAPYLDRSIFIQKENTPNYQELLERVQRLEKLVYYLCKINDINLAQILSDD